MKSFAHHETVPEAEDNDERLNDCAAGRLDAEEASDVPSMPGRLGHADIAGGPGRDLARLALYLDIEGSPPLPVMGGGAFVTMPCLTGREIVEAAFRMKGGQGRGEVLLVLCHQMAVGEIGECPVQERLQ